VERSVEATIRKTEALPPESAMVDEKST